MEIIGKRICEILCSGPDADGSLNSTSAPFTNDVPYLCKDSLNLFIRYIRATMEGFHTHGYLFLITFIYAFLNDWLICIQHESFFAVLLQSKL